MSTAATDTTCHTRPSNATTRPGKIVLEAQVKRRSKAQKAADDLALKEAKEAKEALFKKRLERLTHIKTEMGKKQGEVLTKKAAPIRPKPRARKVTKTAVVEHGDHQGDSILDDLPEADEIDNHQRTPTEQMDDVPATTGKGKKVVVGKRGSTKTTMHDAISNMQKKHNKSSSNVEATILGGRVTNWVSAVKPGKLESSPHASSLSTREPPSTIFSHNTASSTANSATQPPSSIGAAQTKHVPDDTLTGAFGDEIDDSLEYEAICEEKQDKRKTKVVSILDENSDSDFDEPWAGQGLLQYDDSKLELSQEPRAPFTQAPNLKSLS
ncbi:hypothetical protein F4604DRAFT_1927719 [Suillus subluteus]|nr:hypothetical protein F4604DRAFT_1927719 [Suillus subluteus]